MPKVPKGKIIMDRADLLREHKNLVKLLDTGKKMVAEATKQRREMKKYV